MKIVATNRKRAIRKREYLPAKSNQRKRTASLVMAMSLVVNAAKYTSDIFLITSQQIPNFANGAKGEEIIFSKIDKAERIIQATKSHAENMASIIRKQAKFMK